MNFIIELPQQDLNLISRLSHDTRNQIFSAFSNVKKRSNCFGTAAYIAGLCNEDSYLDSFELTELLCENMTRVTQPRLESLALFETTIYGYPSIPHAGIVLLHDPLFVFSRIGIAGHCTVMTVDDIKKKYPCSSVSYYIPKKN